MGHQRVFIAKWILTPGGFAEQIDGNDLSRASVKSLEQSKLFGSQGKMLSVFDDLRPLKVDLAGSQTDQGRFFLRSKALTPGPMFVPFSLPFWQKRWKKAYWLLTGRSQDSQEGMP